MKNAELTDAKAARVASGLNDLLRMHGVPVGGTFANGEDCRAAHVGCTWCVYSQAFDVTLPKSFQPVLRKVSDMLIAAGYRVTGSDWSHLGSAGGLYVHLTAWAF